MKATVQIERADAMDRSMSGRPIHRDVECTVRLGVQGYGSVELDLPMPSGATVWRTLNEALADPRVLGVTFRGPWSDEPVEDERHHQDDRKPIVR